MAIAMQREELTIADILAMKTRIEEDIRQHRAWYVFQGIVFLIFGLFAAVVPFFMAVSATLFIGALLLITGGFQFVASVRSRMHWWSFLSALLSIMVGGWMIWSPVAGTMALVMAVALFLAVEGLLEILLAFEFRPARNWGWMLASGIASLALFALLCIGFPVLGFLYLGLIIAFNFIFYGVSLLMLVGRVSQ
jgi:uncharacterized membrane protein HdeD (DUF308 family)